MTMLAFEISQPGGPEVLRHAQRMMPSLGAGELLIRVQASGINRPDVLQRQGAYPPPPGASDLPGLEVAGVIEAGDAALLAEHGFAIGQNVCALTHGGGYAEFCVAPVGQCLPWPSGFSAVQAASLPETMFTVWANVFDRARLQPGETLLIQGGSSGIGVAAIQMAKAHGARVFVTAGSDAKCQACLDLGADAAINYKRADFSAEVQRLTDGRGVDVILDMVAGEYVAREVQCLADDGRLVIIAVQGGVGASLNAGLVLRKRLTISGSTLRPRTVAYKAQLASALKAKAWPWLESGQVKPVISAMFSARDPQAAAQAHALMESGGHIGKIMLEWSGA